MNKIAWKPRSGVQAIVDTGYIHQPEKVKEAYGAEVTVVSSDNTVNYTTLSWGLGELC